MVIFFATSQSVAAKTTFPPQHYTTTFIKQQQFTYFSPTFITCQSRSQCVLIVNTLHRTVFLQENGRFIGMIRQHQSLFETFLFPGIYQISTPGDRIPLAITVHTGGFGDGGFGQQHLLMPFGRTF